LGYICIQKIRSHQQLLQKIRQRQSQLAETPSQETPSKGATKDKIISIKEGKSIKSTSASKEQQPL
jgi:hypothetical protein